MNNGKDNNTNITSFTYSAKEQAELKKIREKYTDRESTAMVRIRRLDQSVSSTSSAISIIVGAIGALLLGLGMTCCMVWQGVWFIPGIAVGIVGIAVIAAAYPIYNLVHKKMKNKVAPEILRLTDELIR